MGSALLINEKWIHRLVLVVSLAVGLALVVSRQEGCGLRPLEPPEQGKK